MLGARTFHDIRRGSSPPLDGRRDDAALHMECIAQRSDRSLPPSTCKSTWPSPSLLQYSLPILLAAFLDLNGYLPIGVPMLKRVLALPGQTVCRKRLTIAVDGIDVGQARERDGRGRPLPVWQGCRTIADGDVFVMNWQSSDSLDGRYFGPLPASAVIGKAIPVWTDEE